MPFDELQPDDALFLDIDGTLLDIADHPDRVIVPPGLTEVLEALRARLDGALAILSGRSMSQVDTFFAPLRFAGAAEHGSVVRFEPEGELEHMTRLVSSTLTSAVTEIVAKYPLVLVEVKTSAIAVHFRNAPDAEAPLAVDLTALLASHAGWSMMRGRRVFDIVPASITKGGALELLHRSAAFTGRRPVMIGDDVTDISALASVTNLRGVALTVASNVFPAETAHFGNPAAVRRWLSTQVESLSRGPHAGLARNWGASCRN